MKWDTHLPFQIICGEARASLRSMEPESVQCAVCSPPYFALRDYKSDPQIWGGEEGCQHIWGAWKERHDEREERKHGKTRTTDRCYGDGSRRNDGNHQKHTAASVCTLCEAMLCELGLEPTVEDYIDHLVEVFAEVKRVLRKDGVFFLNIGDCFNAYNGNRGTKSLFAGDRVKKEPAFPAGNGLAKKSLKPKDMMLIHCRLSIALQESGWWVRSIFPWFKNNGLTQSVRDRPTVNHEWFLMLTKSAHYFWDIDAIRRPHDPGSLGRMNRQWNGERARAFPGQPQTLKMGGADAQMCHPNGRNYRTGDLFRESLDVEIEAATDHLEYLESIKTQGGLLLDEDGDPAALLVNTQPFLAAKYGCSDAEHYAAFPVRLINPLIRAATSDGGACAGCGSPYRPTNEWKKSCRCETEETVPCTVMDCFSGTGTSGEAALRLNRRYRGIEIKPEWAALSEKRLRHVSGHTGLFEIAEREEEERCETR